MQGLRLLRRPAKRLLIRCRHQRAQPPPENHQMQHPPDLAHQALIRNIGIIAHIDAGKTTTTERMLYLVGQTKHQGAVDAGDTVTDFMVQERERGITIQSAVVSLQWGGRWINLIDTPGHVDFSIEVERCMRVLDGAVLVLDAVVGVQAQTETVWRAAARQGIPAVAFVNKMDKEGADLDVVLSSMKSRLGVLPLPLELPIVSKEGDGFRGAVDLISMQALMYRGRDEGRALQASDRDDVVMDRVQLGDLEDNHLANMAHAARKDLLQCLAECDEEFMDLYLSEGEDEGEYTPEMLLGAIRRATLAAAAVPVLCGAAVRGIGVEPLLDSVVSFLPSPLDRPKAQGVLARSAGKKRRQGRQAQTRQRGLSHLRQGDHEEQELVAIDPALSSDLVALAFKVSHDQQRGPLVYFRVYGGELKPKQYIYNTTRGLKERPLQLLQVHGDALELLEGVNAGQVAAAVGLKETFTGDTLVCSHGSLKNLHLSGVSVPQPVFSLVVEEETSADAEALTNALAIMAREDPSLIVTEEDGQTVISGVGELHLEIVCDRLRREFGVPVHTGKVAVHYKETAVNPAQLSRDYSSEHSGRRMFAGLDIELEHLDGTEPAEVEVSDEIIEQLGPERAEALQDGLLTACLRGPLGGFPLVGIRLVVQNVRLDAVHSTPGALRFAADHAVRDVAMEAEGELLEPCMSTSIAVPEAHLGGVLNDLTATRRATIAQVTSAMLKLLRTLLFLSRHCQPVFGSPGAACTHRHTVEAQVPVKELLGYASALRSITGGEGSFTMEFAGYRPCRSADLQQW
ncbi:unnamed protein product [Chrysoparadoxa australica]